MKVSISNGELLDKVTILKLKLDNVTDEEKLKHIRKEHDTLVAEMMVLTDTIENKDKEGEYLRLYDSLYATNNKLWILEDRIREKEKRNIFDQDFIEVSRAIYYTNDVRADIKRKINSLTNSAFVEVKNYLEYE